MKWLGMTIASKDRTTSLFNFLRFASVLKAKVEQMPEYEETIVSHLPPHAQRVHGERGYSAIVDFLGVTLPETTLLNRQDGHETTTSEAPNPIRVIPYVSACFRLSPLVSA